MTERQEIAGQARDEGTQKWRCPVKPGMTEGSGMTGGARDGDGKEEGEEVSGRRWF